MPNSKKEKVTKVIDGDTFKTPTRTVRLNKVDAPEKGRPGAQAATKKLRRLIEDQPVGIQPVARDRYGRTVANVRVGRQSVNRIMREATKPPAPKPKPKPKASAPKPKPRPTSRSRGSKGRRR